VEKCVFFKIQNGGKSKWAELRGQAFLEHVKMDISEKYLVNGIFWVRGVAVQTLKGR